MKLKQNSLSVLAGISGIIILAAICIYHSGVRSNGPPPAGKNAELPPPPVRKAAGGNELVSAGTEAAWPGAPEYLRKIAGLDQEISFREKLALVHSLSRKLSDSEKDFLYHFLKYGKNDTDNHVLKNDIINVLRDQQPPPPELTKVMLDIFYDKGQDIVMRSYALQHMRPWYCDERMKDAGIVKAFNDGVKEYDTEIAGVALLALRDLSEQFPEEFDSNQIAHEAAGLVKNDGTCILSRISAVSICGQMNVVEALPAIRQTASSGSSTALRTAAIAAVGGMGDTSDLELLQKLSDAPVPVSTAAKAAIKKIAKKYSK